IIVIGVWNNDITYPRESDPFYRAVDLTIARAAARASARFADPFPLFNPQGSVAREKARICAYTFICSRGDGHPTDAGYRAIAAAVFTAFRLRSPLVSTGAQSTFCRRSVATGRFHEHRWCSLSCRFCSSRL